jgi:hypothetical protein
MDTNDFKQQLEDRQDEKLSVFEESTIAEILKILGMPAIQIKRLKQEFGERFGCDWFNDQDYILPTVITDRCFNFNFEQLFKEPLKCPVLKVYEDVLTELDGRDICFVFKSYGLGRLVFSNYIPALKPSPPHYCITDSRRLYLFKDYFQTYFADVLAE